MKKITPLSFLLVAACGGPSVPCPAKVPDAPPTPPPSAVPAAPCTDGGASASDTPDPDVMQLATAAKSCAFENGRFDWECAAFKAWARDNDDLFEGGSANATILKMLEDDDVRTRTLAVERGFSAGRAFFADKKHAERLLAVIDKEREPHLLGQYGRFAAFIDAERTGLTAPMKAFAKHPSVDLRQTFASTLLPQHPNAFSLDLVKTFLDDPDNSVRRGAITSLSGNGRTRPSPEICATLKGQLARTDRLAEDAIEAASSSKCDGMQTLAVAEAEKRAADPKKLLGNDGLDLRSPLSSICWRGTATDDLKKRVFDIAVKVTPLVDDAWRKRSWLDLFRNCDPKRAKDVLPTYVKDKDKDVAKEAKEELKRAEEEAKRK